MWTASGIHQAACIVSLTSLHIWCLICFFNLRPELIWIKLWSDCSGVVTWSFSQYKYCYSSIRSFTFTTLQALFIIWDRNVHFSVTIPYTGLMWSPSFCHQRSPLPEYWFVPIVTADYSHLFAINASLLPAHIPCLKAYLLWNFSLSMLCFWPCSTFSLLFHLPCALFCCLSYILFVKLFFFKALVCT